MGLHHGVRCPAHPAGDAARAGLLTATALLVLTQRMVCASVTPGTFGPLRRVVAEDADAGLNAWRERIWMDGQNTLFLMVTDSTPENAGVGVYARSGDTPLVKDNANGYKNPVEFFWGQNSHRYPMGTSAVDKASQYSVKKVGTTQTEFSFAEDKLKGIVLRIRQVDGRWVAVALNKGEPFIVQYAFGVVAYSFGVPTGLSSMTFHGFPLKDCKINFNESVQVAIGADHGGEWEYKAGMVDPLCACEPNPTCGLPGGLPCAEYVETLLEAKVSSVDVYTSYLDFLRTPNTRGWKYPEVEYAYTRSQLENASCNAIPATIPLSVEARLESCTDVFLAEAQGTLRNYLQNGQWQTVIHSQSEMIRMLEAPRLRWLWCMQGAAQRDQLMFLSSQSSLTVEHLRISMQSLQEDFQAQQTEGQMSGNYLVLGMAALNVVSLLLLFRRQICGCLLCRCLRRGSQSRSLQGPVSSQRSAASGDECHELATPGRMSRAK